MKRVVLSAIVLSMLALFSCETESPLSKNEQIEGDWTVYNILYVDTLLDIPVFTYEINDGNPGNPDLIVELTSDGYYEHNDNADLLNPKEFIHLYQGYDGLGGGTWQLTEDGSHIHFDKGVNEFTNQPADLWKILELSDTKLIIEKNQGGLIYYSPVDQFFLGSTYARIEFRK